MININIFVTGFDMKKNIAKINSLLIQHFGVPEKAKKLPDPLDAIIGTILSQNTNDNNSYKAYRNLKENFKSWDELIPLTPAKIEKYIRVAGLGKQKSKAIYNLLQSLKKTQNKLSLNHITKKPNEIIIEELTSYSGVGVKTASCVLLFSLDRNICPVDTHVHRTLNRIGLVKTSAPEKTFFTLLNQLPEGTAHSFHTNLIKLGRDICKSQKPVCSICPLNKICKYESKNFEIAKPSSKNNFMLLDNLN